MENETADLLSEIPAGLEDATKGQRLANYLADLFLFYLVLVAVLVVYITVTNDDTLLAKLEYDMGVFERLVIIFMYGLFMSIVEGFTRGRSLGKLFTGTKAVTHDGQAISWETAFKRGLVRLVPFEAISALIGQPWHDRWTRSRVVKIRR